MIDNTLLIKSLLDFSNNTTYKIMVLIRKKDQIIPENHQSARLIKIYYIDSIDCFNRHINTIKALCHLEKARAYVNLNGKNIDGIGLKINYLCGLYLNNQQKGNCWKSLYESAFSLLPTKNKKWVIDVDVKDFNEENFENCLSKVKPYGNKIITKIPTKNGFHYITKPFDLNSFNALEEFNLTKEDVKKEAETLLYSF